MQVAAGSWILEAMKVAPKRVLPRVERVAAAAPEQRAWTPPSAEGRGLLIDLLV